MVGLYCRDHHAPLEGLCGDCASLLAYAEKRLRVCPFSEDKPVCNRCPVHCYAPALRQRVQAVMRYAGPRMLLRHPWLTVLHLLDTLRPTPEHPRRARRQLSGPGPRPAPGPGRKKPGSGPGEVE
jgi:hypothetical protein